MISYEPGKKFPLRGITGSLGGYYSFTEYQGLEEYSGGYYIKTVTLSSGKKRL